MLSVRLGRERRWAKTPSITPPASRRYRTAAISPAVLLLAVAACGGSASSAPTTVAPSFSTAIGAGMAALRLGNDNAAQQLFADAVRREPGNAGALFDLGLAYQDEGLRRDALLAYARALEHAPDDVRVEFNRAVLYSARDAPLAMFLYRRVIALQPDSPTAYLNLGLLEAQAHLTSARADLEKAVQLEPSLAGRIPAALRATLAGPAPPSSPLVTGGSPTTGAG